MASVFTTRLLMQKCVFRFTHLPKPRILSASCSLYTFSANSPLLSQNACHSKLLKEINHVGCIAVRYNSQDSSKQPFKENDEKETEKKLSIFQKFKDMYKKYWYVLVPVHLVTSACWFGGFYYLAKSGVDIIGLLENMNVSEKLINPLRDSSMGYVAVAYALYKIATPARYTVTLGGTTVSINYLKKWGYIKPVPTKDELKEIYTERKENFMESVRETKEEIRMQKDKLMEKKDDIVDKFRFPDNIKDKKDNIVKDLEKSLKDKQQKLQNKKDNILQGLENNLNKKVKNAK